MFVRLIAVLLLAAAAWGLFRLPQAQPSRLAALETYRLLGDEDVEMEPLVTGELEQQSGAREDAERAPVQLGALVLGTSALEVLERDDEGRPRKGRLRLYGARVVVPDDPDGDLTIHGEFRTAVLRGLLGAAANEELELEILGEQFPSAGGVSFLLERMEGELRLSYNIADGELHTFRRPWSPPRKSSLYPPLVAIALAILVRKPVISLFLGVATGAFLLRHGSGESAIVSVGAGLWDVFRTFLWDEVVELERAQIIGFVVAMLAMVGIVTKNGGIRGIMNAVAKLASTARRTQFATYLMGLAVFFDDYANTILVGSTMRPLSDRFRISREKLAYLVDSTAAPVAGLSIFSTWIAFEVSTFSAQLPLAGMSPDDGYSVFIQTVPFRFYCIFSLVLVAIVTLSGRDFGPMLSAERRARTKGELVRPGGKPLVGEVATAMKPVTGIDIRAHRAVLPLLAFVFVTLFEILRAGTGGFAMPTSELLTLEGITAVLYGGSGSWPLLVGSSTGLALAIVLSLLAGLRGDVWLAAWNTLRSMGIAIVILYLAWMIGTVCKELGTAAFLTVLLGDVLDPLALPTILFLLAGAVSFSTGSSWGTMSILLPLVVGLSFGLGEKTDLGGTLLMVMSIGAVLEGSIFGDHCSPISDTTVLSSVAAASDHIDHVRTQAPYALLCMTVAIVVGYLPCAVFGMSPWFGLAGGAVLLYLCMRILGERTEDPPREGTLVV